MRGRRRGAGPRAHPRTASTGPPSTSAACSETVAALREGTSLVVQLSTGGSVHDPLDARLRVLEAAPDSCSLTCGTVNFGDDVFLNPWPFMVELYEAAREARVVPEFELFDLGHVAALRRLLDTCGLPYGGKVHCDFVTRRARRHARARRRRSSPASQALPAEVTSWSATGIGRTHLPVLAAALSLGGHLRVGMEDNIVYARGRQVRSNAELVERAARLATELQRPPMSTVAGARPARASLVVNGRRAGGRGRRVERAARPVWRHGRRRRRPARARRACRRHRRAGARATPAGRSPSRPGPVGDPDAAPAGRPTTAPRATPPRRGAAAAASRCRCRT